jgi:hypothetical protein
VSTYGPVTLGLWAEHCPTSTPWRMMMLLLLPGVHIRACDPWALSWALSNLDTLKDDAAAAAWCPHTGLWPLGSELSTVQPRHPEGWALPAPTATYIWGSITAQLELRRRGYSSSIINLFNVFYLVYELTACLGWWKCTSSPWLHLSMVRVCMLGLSYIYATGLPNATFTTHSSMCCSIHKNKLPVPLLQFFGTRYHNGILTAINDVASQLIIV